MSGTFFTSADPGDGPLPEIDTTVPSVPRMYNYLIGGDDWLEVDRAAAEQALLGRPALRRDSRANRAFDVRALRYLAGEQGVKQFLDLGSGLPTWNSTHQVAQAFAADARVVYVDNDPAVAARSKHLLMSSPEGLTAFLLADLRDVGTVLDRAAEVLDLRRPVSVMLAAVLHCLPDEDDPYGLVAAFMDAMAPGSYLTITQIASDMASDQIAAMSDRIRRVSAATGRSAACTNLNVTPRSHDETMRFFAGLTLIDPGLVPVTSWRPAPGEERVPVTPAWAGVGRKG